jgi:hypothetical protein
VLAKNISRLAKSTASLNNLDITINWESNIGTDQYYLVVDTHQQVANGTQVGERSQRHLIRVFDASNSTSPTLRFSQNATTFGNNAPAGSMTIASVYVNGNSLTMRSSTNWVTSGTLTHSFTVDVLQVPDVSTIGFVWLT